MRQEQGRDDGGDRNVGDLVPEEDRRDQPVGLREHLRDPLGPAVPILLPPQKIHPAQGEQRRLRRREKSGGKEKEGEEDRFHAGVSGSGASAAGSDRIRKGARRPRARNRPRAGRESPRPSSPRRPRSRPKGKSAPRAESSRAARNGRPSAVHNPPRLRETRPA